MELKLQLLRLTYYVIKYENPTKEDMISYFENQIERNKEHDPHWPSIRCWEDLLHQVQNTDDFEKLKEEWFEIGNPNN